MLSAEERQTLEALRDQIACDHKFACIGAAVTDICRGKYYSELDIMECQQTSDPPCKFCRPFGCKFVCICPLRKYIAKNFDRWSAESTAMLRPRLR